MRGSAAVGSKVLSSMGRSSDIKEKGRPRLEPPRNDLALIRSQVKLAGGAGDAFDFLAYLGFDDGRQIGVQPFLQHRAQQAADHFVDGRARGELDVGGL